ncbi:MAG: hypothetical protein WB239_12425 [Acidimicrobiia bacterium]
MEDRIGYRVGAWGAIIGGTLAIVVNVFRPEHATANHLRAMVGIIVVSLLFLPAFFALTRSIDNAPASGWARLAWGVALVGVTFSIASHAIYAALDRSHDVMGAGTLDGVELVADSLFFVWAITFFGATALLYGLAMARSSGYPTWLGWVTMSGGVVGFVAGFTHAFSGATSATESLFAISAGVFSLVILYVGILLLQQSSTVDSRLQAGTNRPVR